MNQGLRNELSILISAASLALSARGRPRWALGLAVGAAAVRFWPQKTHSFEGKSIVITGGSRGLGLALAQNLVLKKAKVTLLARDREELDRAIDMLSEVPECEALALVCDVTDKAQLRQALDRVNQRFGHLDILINNAGSVSAGPFESMESADYEAQMRIHFGAAMEATYLALPQFKAQGFGHIVNISSIGGKIPVPHMIPYCASKYALSGFSQALTTELKKDNICVTTVYPGLMRTGSAIQAVFKGDHQKEFAWFAVMDSLPGISISARHAADAILSAIAQKKTEVIVSPTAKMATIFHGMFPEIYNSLSGWLNRLLPQGFSQDRKTGAQSQSWLSERFWSGPVLNSLKRNQQEFNEREKFDPDFNINLTVPNSKLIH